MGKADGGAARYLGSYARFFAGALARVTVLDAANRFDVIEAHNMPDFLAFAALAPKLRGASLILNLHDTFPELFATTFDRAFDSLPVRVVRIQERLSARFVDALVTVTEEAGERLASRGVAARRNLVIMNSPDEGIFGPQREPKGLPEVGEIRGIYHGGLAHRFGVEILIEAVAHVRRADPRLSLHICGGGSTRERLVSLAGQLDSAGITFSTDPYRSTKFPTSSRGRMSASCRRAATGSRSFCFPSSSSNTCTWACRPSRRDSP